MGCAPSSGPPKIKVRTKVTSTVVLKKNGGQQLDVRDSIDCAPSSDPPKIKVKQRSHELYCRKKKMAGFSAVVVATEVEVSYRKKNILEERSFFFCLVFKGTQD